MKKIGVIIPLLCLFPLIGCQNKSNGGNSGNNTSVVEDIFYRVNITQSEHGIISANKEQVRQGDLVTFTFTPHDGFALDKVYVNNEEVTPVGNHYTVINVQQDITISATFVQSDIVVRYFNNDKLVLVRRVLPNHDASYIGKEPTKDYENGKSFRFVGWSLEQDGDLVTSFVFNKSTDLFSVFEEVVYTFTMKESLNIKTFETASLDIVTDYPDATIMSGLIVADSSICDIDKNFNVFGRKKGTTNINFVVGGTVIKTCAVSVNNIDNVRTELCYASGAVEYNDNYSVGRYKACQTLIKKLDGSLVNQKFIDFSGDFMFDASLSSSDNFGIQFDKEITSSGTISKGYHFGCTTGYDQNVFLKVNGNASTKISYQISANVVYNFRVRTTQGSTDDKVRIECFIDGNKIIDVEKPEITGTTNYIGFRYANASTSTNYINFTNLYLQ
jgi:hypothetical protein